MIKVKHDHLIRGIPDTTWLTLDNMEIAFGVKTKGKLLTKIADAYNLAIMKQWEPPLQDVEQTEEQTPHIAPPKPKPTPPDITNILNIVNQASKGLYGEKENDKLHQSKRTDEKNKQKA